MIGQSISHYRITSKIGEGGMGVVYRATDAKLNRDVALKVLPDAFAADRERMARFSREAQVLASLNHPNIASIYGLEDSNDKQALVLELVEGETLAEQVSKGAIPLEESLKIALQMAQAVDKRADIWAFGCVLFEMLTGKRVFGGQTMTDILGAIVHKEPDWEALPESTPQGIHRLLRRCLDKDPHERLRDIGDARIVIRYALSEPSDDSPVGVTTASPVWWRRNIPWAVAALLAILLALSSWELTPEPTKPMRFSLNLPSPFAGQGGLYRMALSPDRNHLVYLGRRSGHQQEIYLRPLDQLEATPIEGTEGATSLFLSPDRKWVGFYADQTH